MGNEAPPANDNPPIDEAAVRRTAYFLWENEGYPEGQAEQYWLRALELHRKAAGYDLELQREPPPREA
ncbi:MAG: DUF2934 domain-containing protein [Devosia sp.]